MMIQYPGGVWPVMLTPFHRSGEVDENALCALVDWYIANGVSGLFASCQSSEIYKLNFEERIRIAKITLKAARGRVPVVASGHVSDSLEEQVKELNAMAETGVDAVILITNHFAAPNESDDQWIAKLETVLSRVDPAVHLGAYECPMPYKRLLSEKMIRAMTATGRFYFLKDTCCDVASIQKKLAVIKGSALKLYNANTATLLTSMRDGAPGYSGIMANFHPELYVWLTQNIHHPNAGKVQDVLSMCALIERQLYPVNAKYHLSAIEELPMTTFSRVQDDALLSETFKEEVRAMNRLCNETYEAYCK